METRRTIKWAVLAQCHECLGHYSDGKQDCENVRCSLYTWMPYRKKDPDMEWSKYNPKRTGKIIWTDCKRPISDEKRAELRKRIKELRKI